MKFYFDFIHDLDLKHKIKKNAITFQELTLSPFSGRAHNEETCVHGSLDKANRNQQAYRESERTEVYKNNNQFSLRTTKLCKAISGNNKLQKYFEM
jgi:hypothetical protein